MKPAEDWIATPGAVFKNLDSFTALIRSIQDDARDDIHHVKMAGYHGLKSYCDLEADLTAEKEASGRMREALEVSQISLYECRNSSNCWTNFQNNQLALSTPPAAAHVSDENSFAGGVISMARNTLPAVELIRAGKWTLDQMEQWLNAVLANDAKYSLFSSCKTPPAHEAVSDKEKMRLFLIEVLPESGDGIPELYKVSASSLDDAMQIAFALDAGWSKDNHDASGMIELAKSYCSEKQPISNEQSKP